MADDYINAVVVKERESGRRVYPIAWHIDYWDYMGWTDPFDTPWATTRQEAYQELNKTTIGTPEMFVNGRSETYETSVTAAAIEAALQNPASAAVTIAVSGSTSAPDLAIAYDVLGAPAETQLHVALVERGLVGYPDAGELAGRTLEHDNVARAYAIVPAGQGTLTLTPPAQVQRDESSIIAFIQDPTTLIILGATQINPW